MPSPSRRPSSHSASRRRGAPARAASGPEMHTRFVIGLVIAFTLAFVGVITTKIQQEWRSAEAVGVAAREADARAQAERSAAAIREAKALVQGAAAGIRIGGAGQTDAELEGYLKELAKDARVAAAALVTADGEIKASVNAGVGSYLSAAEALRAGRDAWLAKGPDEVMALHLAAGVESKTRTRILIVRLAPSALGSAPVGDGAVVIADKEGLVAAGLKGGRALEGGVLRDHARLEPLSFQSLQARPEGQRVFELPPTGREGARAIGVAPFLDGELWAVVDAPRSVDMAAFQRTLLFYLLLLVAPLLVAVGLLTMLVLQMDSIKQARRDLAEGAKRLQLAIEGARCGVWDWDIANDEVTLTDYLARMLGLREGSTLSGAEFLALVRPDDQDKFALAIRNAPNAGEVDCEFRANNLPVWLHARGRPWTGADGQPSGHIVGVAIDITEQRGAQALVDAAERRLRAALESMSESFALWDSRRRLVLSNKKFREFFHLDAKLVKPGAAYEMLELAAQGAIKAVHNTSEEHMSEYELADGRWLQFSERPTVGGGLVSIGADITALKRQEGLLLDKQKELEQTIAKLNRTQERLADLAKMHEEERIRADDANRAKSEFLATMSHELRTPLNAINGFSEIMSQEMFGPLGDRRYKEYASDILISGMHLLALINDILDMAKIEAGKLQLLPQKIFIDDLVEQSVRLMRGKASEGGLTLSVELSEAHHIEADPRAIKQVLINLLSNAIKFTPEGGKVTVRAAADAAHGGVVVSVADTGIGVAEKDLARLGRPFEQIESTQSRKHKGSGLGLALSKSLVAMHGGELSIASAMGKGTTVTFWLPPLPRADAGDRRAPLPTEDDEDDLPSAAERGDDEEGRDEDAYGDPREDGRRVDEPAYS